MPKVYSHRSREFRAERGRLSISSPKSPSSDYASSSAESNTSSDTLYLLGLDFISRIAHDATEGNQHALLNIIHHLSELEDMNSIIHLYNEISSHNCLTTPMLNAFLDAAFENKHDDFALHLYHYAVTFSTDNPHNPLTNTHTHEIVMYYFLEADYAKIQLEKMHDFYKNAIATHQLSCRIFEMMYYTAFLSSKLPMATVVLAHAVRKNQSSGSMISHSQRMGLFQNMPQTTQDTVRQKEEDYKAQQQFIRKRREEKMDSTLQNMVLRR